MKGNVMYKIEVNFEPAVYTRDSIEDCDKIAADYRKIFKDAGVTVQSVIISAGIVEWSQEYIG